MSMQLPDEFPVISFPSAQDFEGFLAREHASAPGLYLKLAKKASGIPSVSASEAIEVALCYGWIDGRAKGLDDNWWLVRYTPRRAKSIWSQKNVHTVQRLIDEGRMQLAGMAAVAAAKADGRWDRAYAGPATMMTPSDFATALNTIPAAASFFEKMNRSDRYSVLWRVETASPTARPKRIETLVQLLATGTSPKALVKPTTNSSKTERITKSAPSKKVVQRKQLTDTDVVSRETRRSSRQAELRAHQ